MKKYTREEIRQKLISVIVDGLGIVSYEDYDENKTFGELGADSLDLVEIMMGLEDELAIEISEEEAEKLHTPKEAIDNLMTIIGIKPKTSNPHVISLPEFHVVNWCCGEKLEKLGFERIGNSYTNYKAKDGSALAGLDVWETARCIFDSGLNVMVYHNSDGSIMLAVDTKRFQQR